MRGLKGTVVRPYRPGDEVQLVKLFQECFGRPIGPGDPVEFWRWKYLRSPYGDPIILVAELGDRIIGQQAALPRPLTRAQREHRSAIIVDAETHPHFRGHGLFREMQPRLIEICAAAGFEVLYGFPARSPMRRLLFGALSWIDVGRCCILVKLLVHRVSKSPPQGGLAIEVVDSVPSDADDLWERSEARAAVGVIRDRTYLRWRYGEAPGMHYDIMTIRDGARLAGIGIISTERRFGLESGLLMDIVVEAGRPDVTDAMIEAAEIRASLRGQRFLSSLTFCDVTLRKRGFRLLPGSLLPREFHLAMRQFGAFAAPDMLDAGKWFVSWGDTDVV